MGAATLEATSTLLLGAIPIARGKNVAASASEQVVVGFLGYQLDFAQGLIEGKSLGQSAADAGIKTVVGLGVGKLMEAEPIKKTINRLAVPLTTRFMSGVDSSDMSRVISGSIEKRFESTASNAISSLFFPKPADQSVVGVGGYSVHPLSAIESNACRISDRMCIDVPMNVIGTAVCR